MTQKIFTASRLSEGNRIFPSEIHIEDNEIMLKIPSLFSGKSRHIIYQQIEGVNIDTPMIGFSTITFVVGGESIAAHGFTQAEAKEIKQVCSEKIIANSVRGQRYNSSGDGRISIADELKKLKDLLDAGVLTQSEFDAQKTKLLNK